MRRIFFLTLCLIGWASARAQLNVKIAKVVKDLNCPLPGEQNPVTLNAALVSDKDSLAIVVKVSLAPGWHIYEYVPDNMPYIAIERILQLPVKVKTVGSWIKTEPATSANDPGVLIYENEAVFIHKAVKSKVAKSGGMIKAGLYYQTCNLRQCLQPKEETFELKY